MFLTLLAVRLRPGPAPLPSPSSVEGDLSTLDPPPRIAEGEVVDVVAEEVVVAVDFISATSALMEAEEETMVDLPDPRRSSISWKRNFHPKPKLVQNRFRTKRLQVAEEETRTKTVIPRVENLRD